MTVGMARRFSPVAADTSRGGPVALSLARNSDYMTIVWVDCPVVRLLKARGAPEYRDDGDKTQRRLETQSLRHRT